METNDVYSRLYDKKSYTGVYRKRFEGDGRINGDTQLSALRVYRSKYQGDTNTFSNETIHDLSVLMRPNLNYGVDKKTKKPILPFSCSPSKGHEKTFTEHQTSSPVKPIKGDPNNPQTILKAVFHYYCRFGRSGSGGSNINTLDNANFVKFCRDCPELLINNFTKIDAELIFVKCKKKGERRLNYTRFLDAIGMIASLKYNDLELEKSVPKLFEKNIKTLTCLKEDQPDQPIKASWKSHIAAAAQKVEAAKPVQRKTVVDVLAQMSPPKGKITNDITSSPLQAHSTQIQTPVINCIPPPPPISLSPPDLD